MCTFSSTASLSAYQRPPRRAGRLDVDLEHHALGDLVVAGDEAVERGVEVGRLDLGEVAELPDVHAEHRHARPRTTRSTARSIVPSPPSEITRSRPSANVGRRPRGARGPRRRRRRRDAHRRCRARPALPRRARRARPRPPRSRCGTRPTRAAVIGAHRRTAAVAVADRPRVERRRRRRGAPGRGRAWNRNSTLPSAPRSGDAIDVDDDEAGAARPSRDLAEHGAVHVGVAHDAALADPGRARPRTAASPAARGRRRRCVQRASAGATVTQRDERQVGDDEVDRPADVVGLERRGRWCARAP